MISLESDGGLVDSILSNTSQQYDTAGSDVDTDEEPVRTPSSRNPGLPLPSQVSMIVFRSFEFFRSSAVIFLDIVCEC